MMKKFTAVLAVVVLILNAVGTCCFADDNTLYKDTLKIGLSYASSAEGWFYSESDIEITDAYYMSQITTVPANTRFRIYAKDGAIVSDYFYPVLNELVLDSATPIYFNNSAYRGSFRLKNYKNTLTVINVVNTEDYLASVLGREMSASWPIEALKAQAVCARNYAVTSTKHSTYGFDLCSTVDCQVYGGIASEAERTRRAVQETKGVVVTYEDKVVSLYYFSCDGGYTEDSENVWTNALGYLRGKQDIYENPEYISLYNWSKTYTKAEIETILTNKGVSIGELKDIRIDAVSDNNGVIQMTFIGSAGEHTVKKSGTRTFLSLNSQAYTIEKHLPEAASGRIETETVSMKVLTDKGIESVTNPMYVLTANGLEKIEYGTYEVKEEASAYASYTFNGHGWGHLVGMSQWGAYCMAKQGYTYKDILNFYFTDIVIEEHDFSYDITDENTQTEDEELHEEETEDSYGEEDEDYEEYEEDVQDDEIEWSDTGL